MHNLIQLSVEELKLFYGCDCITCNQLRRGLKEALMYALLSSTSSHLYAQVTAQTQSRNAEINLTYALRDFREHRRLSHSVDHFIPSWTAASRNAS